MRGCIKFILRLRSKLYQLEIAFDTRGMRSCAASGFIMSTRPARSLRIIPTGDRYMNESNASYSDSMSFVSGFTALNL